MICQEGHPPVCCQVPVLGALVPLHSMEIMKGQFCILPLCGQSRGPLWLTYSLVHVLQLGTWLVSAYGVTPSSKNCGPNKPANRSDLPQGCIFRINQQK